MTFRIDFVSKDQSDGNCTWHFGIKGLRGKGIYCDLSMDENGRGLSILHNFPNKSVQLLSADAFAIPATATRWNARKRLAVALTTLGWGPAVHDEPDSER